MAVANDHPVQVLIDKSVSQDRCVHGRRRVGHVVPASLLLTILLKRLLTLLRTD